MNDPSECWCPLIYRISRFFPYIWFFSSRTIRKLQECDAHDNVLVVAAHDTSLLSVADFFPRRANDFAAKGWVRQARWAFLKDFAEAVGYEGEIVNKYDFSPVKRN